jgi:uncharacterized protein (DUF2267 family)
VTQTNLDAIPRMVEKTREWVAAIDAVLGGEDEHGAWVALRAVLHALRDRLPVETVGHLSAQLPMLVRGLLFEGWDPTGKPERLDREQFVDHVRRQARLESMVEAERTIRAVVEVMWGHLSEGVMQHVAEALPPDYEGLLF